MRTERRRDFQATRPTILNGIPEFATRPDLVDRTIINELAPISEEARRTEEDLWAAFEAVRPVILGCLLDGMAQALRQYRDVRLSQSPRMADFARLAVASEPVLWPEGSFELAYVSNREMAMDTALEADLVGDAVRRLMAANREWVGTATELLALLAGRDGLYVSDEILRRREFPTSPKALSDRLRRIAPFLRKVGITVSGFETSGAVASPSPILWINLQTRKLSEIYFQRRNVGYCLKACVTSVIGCEKISIFMPWR